MLALILTLSLYMKRIEYIDALRGFAIFLMVVGHVIPNLYLNKQIILPNLQTWIYAFHMPLFFTISGYFIYRDSKITAKEAMNQIYKKFLQLLLPAFVMSLLYSIIWKTDFSNNYWFLYALFKFYLFCVIIQYINSRLSIKNDYILFAEFVLLYVLLNMLTYVKLLYVFGDYWILTDNIGYLPFLALGVFLKKFNKVNNWFKENYLFYTLLLLVVLFSLNIIFDVPCIIKDEYFDYLVKFRTFVFILFFWSLFMKYLHKIPKKVHSYFINIGSQTKEIYILHAFLLYNVPFVGYKIVGIESIIPYSSIFMQLLIALPLSVLVVYVSLCIKKILNLNKIVALLTLGEYKIK